MTITLRPATPDDIPLLRQGFVETHAKDKGAVRLTWASEANRDELARLWTRGGAKNLGDHFTWWATKVD